MGGMPSCRYVAGSFTRKPRLSSTATVTGMPRRTLWVTGLVTVDAGGPRRSGSAGVLLELLQGEKQACRQAVVTAASKDVKAWYRAADLSISAICPSA